MFEMVRTECPNMTYKYHHGKDWNTSGSLSTFTQVTKFFNHRRKGLKVLVNWK